MQMSNIPFGVTDWSQIVATEHPGETGMAYWKTLSFGDIRVRLVGYTPGSVDHWCVKGHILLCLEGELHTELEDGRLFTLQTGNELSGRGQCRAPSLTHNDGNQALHC